MEQGAKEMPSMLGTARDVFKEGGLRALYSGAQVSMTGAAIYCGLKFFSYDACKELCRSYLPDPEGPPSALHRAMSGGLAGVMAPQLKESVGKKSYEYEAYEEIESSKICLYYIYNIMTRPYRRSQSLGRLPVALFLRLKPRSILLMCCGAAQMRRVAV